MWVTYRLEFLLSEETFLPITTSPRTFLSQRLPNNKRDFIPFKNFGTGAKVSYVSEPFLPLTASISIPPVLHSFSVTLITQKPFPLSLSDICYTVNQTKNGVKPTAWSPHSFPLLPPPTTPPPRPTDFTLSLVPFLTTWRMSFCLIAMLFSLR